MSRETLFQAELSLIIASFLRRLWASSSTSLLINDLLLWRLIWRKFTTKWVKPPFSRSFWWWGFIVDLEATFYSVWSGLDTPSYSMKVWHSGLSHSVDSYRATRFSPYFFILYLELLSLAFQAKGDQLGVEMTLRGTIVSHLLFVDDILITTWASTSHVRQVLALLEDYCS